MKHKLKRALSAALACAMVFTLLPASVLAASSSQSQTVYVYAQVVDENGIELTASELSDLNSMLGTGYILNKDGWMTLGKTTMDLSAAYNGSSIDLADSDNYAAALKAIGSITRYGSNTEIDLDAVTWKTLTGAAGAADYADEAPGSTYVWHLDGKIPVADVVGLTVTAKDVAATYDGEPHGIAAPVVNVQGAAEDQEVETTPTIDYADESGNPILGTPVNAGTYTARVSVSLTGQYSWITATTEAKVTITPKPVTVSLTAQDKVYDGTASAEGTLVVSGALTDEEVTATAAGMAFSDKNVGTGKPVTASGITLNNSNYKLVDESGNETSAASATADITPKPVTVSLTVQNKVYDGTAAADGMLTVSGALTGETVTASAAGIAFSNKNVGTGKPVTASGITLDNNNYKLVDGSGNETASASTTADITAKELTVTATATDRAYDGTTSVAVNIGALVGVVSGDTVSIDNPPTTGTMEDADIGTNKPVTIAKLTLTGTDAANYTLTQPTITVNITKSGALSVSAPDVTVPYDGQAHPVSPTANVTGAAVTVTYTDASNNPVDFPVDAGTYTAHITAVLEGYVDAAATASVTIDRKELTVTAGATNRDYDGTTTVAVQIGELAGVVAGDAVEIATRPTSGTVESADVGDGKAVSIGTLTLTGADQDNYTLVQPTVTVDITPKAVTITVTGRIDTRAYTGSEQSVEGFDVTGNPAGVTVALKSGESAIAKGTDASDDKYMMSLTQESFEVTGAGNYTVTLNVADGWLKIDKADRPANAQVSAVSYDAPYDGAAHGITVNGAVLAGDKVYYSATNNGSDWDAAPITRTDVQSAETIYVMVENSNYKTADTQATITITQRAVTITVNDAEKFYGEDDPAFTYAITAGSLVSADDLGTITCSRTKGEFDDESVGTYQNVLTASYTGNSNYTVTVIPGSFTIKTASIQGAYVETEGGSRVYNGQPFTASAEVKGAAGYTIQYSADGGKTWTTDAPSVTDVADGTVTVSVKATRTGYENLTGSDVTIAVTARPITITADSASKVYDGKALTKDSFTSTVPTEENPDEGLVSGQTVTATVAGSQTKIGQSDNTASDAVIKAGEADVTGNYSISYKEGTLTVTAAAGVEVTKEVITESGILGYGEISWKVTVTNNGSSTAYGLKLVDSIEGAVITAGTTGDEGVKDPRSFDLEAGASAAFIVTYAPTQAGTYTNNIQVTQPTDDPQNPDRTLDEDTADDVGVAEPVTDVSVSKDRATGASVTVGDTIQWIITIRNGGNVPASVTVTDQLDGAVLTLNGETVAADTLLTVPAGGEIRIEVSYKTTANDAGKTLINKVVVTEPNSEPDGTEKEYTDEDEGTKIEYPYVPPIVVPDPTVKVKDLNTVDHVTYLIGVGDDKVNPTGTITRAEIAAIYFRLMTDEFRSANWSTENRFRDVPNNAWYTMAVLTLDKAGVITDSDDGSFRPEEPITRAELAVLAAQFCTVTGNIPKTSFLDVPADHWAAQEIALVEYAGWIEGCGGYFRPNDTLKRAEAVTIVNRMLQRGVEEENMLPDMVTFVDNTPDQWYYEAIQEAANCHDYTRTVKLLTGETFRGEKWTALLEATDWAALEKAWIEANS